MVEEEDEESKEEQAKSKPMKEEGFDEGEVSSIASSIYS